MLPAAARSTFLQNGCKQNLKHIPASENQNFYCIFEPLKILIFAHDLCNFSNLDPLRKSEILCCISFFWFRRALHPFSYILYGTTCPPFQFLLIFWKNCLPLERQAQFWKSFACKGSKMISIWHSKISENVPLWTLLPSNLPICLPSEFSRHPSHSHFSQTSDIGGPLGYEFRVSPAVPFVHVSFNTLFSIDVWTFFCFL